MSPEERELISGLFDRMRGFGAPEKDRDAEALINQSVRQIPDAAYMLVQSVLVQEQALQQADQRIQDLEARTSELETALSRAQPQPASGSFLGGLFGGGARSAGAAPARPASVPTLGRSVASPGGPWGQSAGAQPMQAQQPQQAQKSGGGFLKTAMATAAGVAGGMILADSIRGMMGGQNAGHGPQSASSNDPASDVNYEGQQTAYQDADNNDPGAESQGASSDNGGGWDGGGGDSGVEL